MWAFQPIPEQIFIILNYCRGKITGHMNLLLLVLKKWSELCETEAATSTKLFYYESFNQSLAMACNFEL